MRPSSVEETDETKAHPVMDKFYKIDGNDTLQRFIHSCLKEFYFFYVIFNSVMRDVFIVRGRETHDTAQKKRLFFDFAVSNWWCMKLSRRNV